MDYVNQLLDKAREISSSATDMALAKELGVTRSAIANYRHDLSVPKDIICAKLALFKPALNSVSRWANAGWLRSDTTRPET